MKCLPGLTLTEGGIGGAWAFGYCCLLCSPTQAGARMIHCHHIRCDEYANVHLIQGFPSPTCLQTWLIFVSPGHLEYSSSLGTNSATEANSWRSRLRKLLGLRKSHEHQPLAETNTSWRSASTLVAMISIRQSTKMCRFSMRHRT